MSSSGIAVSTEWLCAYVYTHEPLRDLLVHDVSPLVSDVRGRGLVERFFFIRYWENGSHLRLRFFGEIDVLETEVLPAIEGRFGHHRLDYVPYEPEVDRYGGAEAIGIAEECFDLSSRVALDILRQTDDDGARGAAMLLHTALAHAFGMTRTEAVGFFESVARSRLMDGDERFFRETRAAIPSAPLAVWEALERGEKLDVPWLDSWIAGLRDIAADLSRVTIRNRLPLAGEFLELIPPRFADRWVLLSSYVHMTNNRLGVTALDEPHIAFLLSRGLAR